MRASGADAPHQDNARHQEKTQQQDGEQQDKEKPLVPDSKVLNTRFSPFFRQFITVIGPLLAAVASGMTSGYSATLLPRLMAPDSEIPITMGQRSWIASIAALPMAPGCLLGGLVMERYGRRVAHFLSCSIALAGWLIIAASNSLGLLLFGRALTGFCVGLLGPPGSCYIGECSEPKYRGIFLAGISLGIATGLLVSHLLGTFLSWQITAGICSTFPMACMLLLAFAPESPSWLAKKGLLGEAEKAFRWLRGHGDDAMDEMRKMLEKQAQLQSVAQPSTFKDTLKKIKLPEVYKPLLVLNLFFFTVQFSGVNAVAFYSVNILQDTLGKDGINEYTAMMVIDVVRCVVSVIACILLRRCGRRPLTTISGYGTAVCLAVLCGVLVLRQEMPPAWCSGASVLLLVGYICFVSIGLVPLPWALVGELFPLAMRGFCSGITSACAFVAFFVVVQTGPWLFETCGPHGAFLFYGAVAFFGTTVLFFCLPETRDKTLQEIEERFAAGKQEKKDMAV